MQQTILNFPPNAVKQHNFTKNIAVNTESEPLKDINNIDKCLVLGVQIRYKGTAGRSCLERPLLNDNVLQGAFLSLCVDDGNNIITLIPLDLIATKTKYGGRYELNVANVKWAQSYVYFKKNPAIIGSEDLELIFEYL